MKFSSFFFLIRSICGLVSAKKESFIIVWNWNLVSIAVLSLKLLFSGFDTTRFPIFFFRYLPVFRVFYSHYHIINSSHITLLAFKKNTIEHSKILKDIDYRFNGLDPPFLKKLIEFFLVLSSTVIFTLSFRSYEISCIVKAFIGFSWKNRRTDILILIDSWWLSWLWKQSFSKIKKKLFNFSNLFIFFFLLPNLVDYKSNMTSWVPKDGVKKDWCPKIYFF